MKDTSGNEAGHLEKVMQTEQTALDRKSGEQETDFLSHHIILMLFKMNTFEQKLSYTKEQSMAHKLGKFSKRN